MAESSYPNAKTLLIEERALNGKTTQEDLLNDRTCLRYWSEIPFGKVAECLDCLRNTASVNNSKASHSVTDPMVNKEKLPGKWRHVQEYALPPRAKTEPDVQDVYQFLKYGWATAIDWTEARLVDGDNQPLQPERFLRVQFVSLDYTKLGAMIDGIETTKYFTDPTVAGEKYTGRYRVLSAKPSRTDDGSGVITLALAKNLVMTPDVLSAPVLLTDDKVLLSPFAHDITSEKRMFVWEYRWIDPSYAQTLRNTIALTAGVIDAKIVKAEDGTCNIQAQTQTNTWAGTLSQVWERVTESPSFAAEKRIETFDHIPLTSLAAFKTALGTATAGFKVSSLIDSTSETLGCAKIVQTQDKLFDGAVTNSNGTLSEEEYLQLIAGGVIRTTMWLGVKDADLDAAMVIVAVAPALYTVLKVGNNYNGTGSFTLIRTMMLKAATPAVPVKMKVEWPTFDDENRTYFYFGMDKATADALLITAQTTCDAGYKVDAVEIQEWRYNMLAVIQQISKLNLTLAGQIRAYDYTKTFGLVNIATTVYLNVAKASIDALKTTILADATKIILDLHDDDVGQGKALVTCVWRSKPAAPVALGAIQQNGPSQFHQPTQDRLWIDVNLTDKDALATAVALAMAGTAPYAVTAGDTIQGAEGQDAGDKTGHIRQRISKKPATYTPALYSEQESFNPHGLREAVMVTSMKEYAEIAYANVGAIFADLQSFLGTPAKGRIQVSMNANETFSMRALKEGTPDWDNAAGTGVQVELRNPGLIGETKSSLATGVPVAAAAALVAAATPDADYALTSVQMRERGQGEAEISKEQAKKSETAVQVSETPAAGARRAQKDYTWPLVLAANVDTVWTAAATEGVTGDYVLHFRQKDFVGGMFRITSQVVEVKEVTISDYTAGYSDDSITTVKEVRDAAALPNAADTANTVETVKGGLNLFNKYDYVKTTVTARVPKSCPAAVAWDELGGWYGIGLWRARYHHTLSFHATAALAAAALAGGWEGSGLGKAGDNLWQAHKVIRDDIYTG
jgi:hypothetical protein